MRRITKRRVRRTGRFELRRGSESYDFRGRINKEGPATIRSRNELAQYCIGRERRSTQRRNRDRALVLSFPVNPVVHPRISPPSYNIASLIFRTIDLSSVIYSTLTGKSMLYRSKYLKLPCDIHHGNLAIILANICCLSFSQDRRYQATSTWKQTTSALQDSTW